MKLPLTLAILIGLAAPQPATAGASDWHATTGAQVRLLSEARADADGDMRGIVEIELEPGWKTYWKAPGGSGIAPMLQIEGEDGPLPVELHFPVPRWFDDEEGRWAGYDGSVAFPFVLEDASPDTSYTASLFLGVCETICVPVQAELTIDPAQAAGPLDQAPVGRAFRALPEPASAEFGIDGITRQGDTLVLSIAADPAPEDGGSLFLAGRDGLELAPPAMRDDGSFAAHILEEPAGDDLAVDYTLSVGDRSVTGSATLR